MSKMEYGTYALIDNDGKVLNIIHWDGVTELNLIGQLIPYDEENPAEPGGRYVDGKFLSPEKSE